MSDVVLVGIDIGTTNLKLVAIRPGGRVVAMVRRPMLVLRPGDGASAFDIDKLERDLVEGLSELRERLAADGIAPDAIAGIGVASIGESFVGLDAGGARITETPTWYDRRTANTRPGGGMSEREWFDITGMVDDDIYTVHRLAWWRRADPARFARVRTWLLVADYVAFLLGGSAAASPSLAARSGMADRRTGAWSPDILAAAGIPVALLPELRPSASITGGLTAAMARATGLRAGTPVVNAGHDHPCAGLGCGLVDPGSAIDSTGTAEALKTVVMEPADFAAAGGGQYDCYPHVVPGRFLLSGHNPAAGGLVDWLMRNFAGAAASGDAGAQLWQAAAAVPPGANGIRIAPFLQGTGAPWNRRDARAEIAGLSADATPAAMLRAALEALAVWLAINLDAFERITGERTAAITLAGGGARNDLANRIKAAILERPLVVPTIDEAAGAGAALVAGLATGLFASASDAARLPDVTSHTIPVDAALADAYRGLRADIEAHITERAMHAG